MSGNVATSWCFCTEAFITLRETSVVPRSDVNQEIEIILPSNYKVDNVMIFLATYLSI